MVASIPNKNLYFDEAGLTAYNLLKRLNLRCSCKPKGLLCGYNRHELARGYADESEASGAEIFHGREAVAPPWSPTAS
jgi:hypothetical protein